MQSEQGRDNVLVRGKLWCGEHTEATDDTETNPFPLQLTSTCSPGVARMGHFQVSSGNGPACWRKKTKSETRKPTHFAQLDAVEQQLDWQ